MRARSLLALLGTFVLTACPAETARPDGGLESPDAGAPTVSSVSPSRGSLAGGRLVTVEGGGFQEGARVYFGESEGAPTMFVSATRLTAVTPAASAAGAVDVRVTQGAVTGTLAQGFTYDAPVQRTFEAAFLRMDALVPSVSASATVHVTVTADVGVTGATEGVGQGAGVLAQVGYRLAPGNLPDTSDFVWTDATYADDQDGPTPGDRLRDRYSGQVALPGATGSQQLEYLLAARFSIDGGQTWHVADRDGTTNGLSAAQLSRAQVSRPRVDWCRLGAGGAPALVTLVEGEVGPKVVGHVFRASVTSAPGQGAGITGELGYGAPGSDPTGTGWTWAQASYSGDTGAGANDAYEATLPNPGKGSYAFAFRFSVDDGPFLTCDADGSNDGYSPAQAGTLTVMEAGVPVVTSCRITPLEGNTVASGAKLGVWGRVRVPGITEPMGQGAGIRGQVGVGTAGTDASSAAGWAWREAAYFGDVLGTGEDEYHLDIQPAYTGSRAVAFRFSVDDGASWTLCDLDGSDVGGHTVAQQPPLSVTPHADLDYCNLQYPPTVTDGGVNIYGRVYESGLTPPAGEPTGLIAQLGHGSRSEDPGISEGWSWVSATWNVQSGNNDEYRAKLGALDAGAYDYAYRFARSAASPWCYGDLNGSTVEGFSGSSGGSPNLGRATFP